MPRVAVLRILARVEDTGHPDATYCLSRRRPPRHQTRAPSQPTGSNDRLVRRIVEVTASTLLNSAWIHLELDSLDSSLLDTHGVSTPLTIPPRWPVRVTITKASATTTK